MVKKDNMKIKKLWLATAMAVSLSATPMAASAAETGQIDEKTPDEIKEESQKKILSLEEAENALEEAKKVMDDANKVLEDAKQAYSDAKEDLESPDLKDLISGGEDALERAKKAEEAAAEVLKAAEQNQKIMQAAYDKAVIDEKAAQEAYDKLASENPDAENAIQKSESAVEDAKNQVAEMEDVVKDANIAYDEAESQEKADKDAYEKALEDIDIAEDELAEAEKGVAKSEEDLDNIQKEFDGFGNDIKAAEEALTAAKEATEKAYLKLKEANDKLEKAKDDHEKSKDEAQKAVDRAQIIYDNIGMFFMEDSCDRYVDAEGNEYDSITVWYETMKQHPELQPYLGVQFESLIIDQFKVDNLERFMDFIDECNELRASEGKDSLYVDVDLMLMSAISNAISSQAGYTAGHITFNTASANSDLRELLFNASGMTAGENLAWGYSDPFDGWYHYEKSLYDQGVRDSRVGHYLNIISENFNTTGFAMSMNRTAQQSFGYDSNAFVTTDMFREAIAKYVDAAKDTLEETKAALSGESKDIIRAREHRDKMKAEYDSAVSKEKDAKKKLEGYGEEISLVKKALDDAKKNLTKANADKTAAEDKVVEKYNVAAEAKVKYEESVEKSKKAAEKCKQAERDLGEAKRKLDECIDKMNNDKAGYRELYEAKQQAERCEKEADNMMLALEDANNDVKDKYSEYEEARKEVAESEKNLKEAELELEKAEATVKAAEDRIEPAQKAYDKAEREYLEALADYTALGGAVTPTKPDTQTAQTTPATTNTDAQPVTGDNSNAAAAAAMMGAALVAAAAATRRKYDC